MPPIYNKFEKPKNNNKKSNSHKNYKSSNNFTRGEDPKKHLQTDSAKNNLELQANDTVRINKALADAGVCSRRKAEEYIAAGKVTVNGKLITELGFKVSLQDVLCVNGQEIQRGSSRCYLLLHKPVQTMCTAYDPEGRSTIFDILPEKWRNKRLFSVGRLDFFSEGLLILTDDGEFAQKLSHPSHNFTKTYRVLVREEVSAKHLEIMQKGMTLKEGEKLAPVEVRVVRPPNANTSTTLLEMVLSQGINRQIRRMCRDLDLTIFKLIRIAQGPILLDNLEVGQVRELTNAEIKALMKH